MQEELVSPTLRKFKQSELTNVDTAYFLMPNGKWGVIPAHQVSKRRVGKFTPLQSKQEQKGTT